jgi:hypothetical protein
METVTTEKQEMAVTTLDGVETTVVATIVKTDHGVVDENGIPKVSVNIIVPSAPLVAEPGQNG